MPKIPEINPKLAGLVPHVHTSRIRSVWERFSNSDALKLHKLAE